MGVDPSRSLYGSIVHELGMLPPSIPVKQARERQGWKCKFLAVKIRSTILR